MKRGTVPPLVALAGLPGVVLFCLIAAHPAATAAIETGRSGSSSSGYSSDYLAVPEPANILARAVDNDPDSLVEKSKRAIIETGISEAYFDKHFKLVKTVNDPADRRVEWLYSVNEYEAQLVDAIGFHATGGQRAFVHGIKNQLYATHEIVKTLPLQRARRILRSCIGKFESESVIYRTLTVPGKARLYLTGRSIPKREQEREPKETEGEQESQFLYVGFVDVETGRCVKKLGRGSS
jgi:hypothetical protein